MRKYLYILFAACCIAACENYDEHEYDGGNTPQQRPRLSAATARQWFESAERGSATRAGCDDDPHAFFRTGELRPAWECGKESSDERIDAVDVPADGEWSYRVICDSASYPLYCGVVVLDEPDSERTCSYTVFYIPSASAAEDYTPDVCACFRNRADDKLLFSGLAVYTLHSGIPVAAVRYILGNPVEGSYLFDPAAEYEQNYDRLYSMLSGIRLLRCRNRDAATRSGDSGEGGTAGGDGAGNDGGSGGNKPDPGNDKYGGMVPQVVCIAPPINRTSGPEPDKPEPPKPPKKDTEVTQDDINPLPLKVTTRPPTGNNTKQSVDFALNTNIKLNCDNIDDILRLLDSLYNDCMGKKLIGSIDESMTICQSDTLKNEGTYNITSRTVTLPVNPLMVDMIEELTHCYQHSANGNNRATLGLNNEIEAKICWSMYVIRHGGNMRDYGNRVGDKTGFQTFTDLAKHYTPNIDSNTDNLFFYHNYHSAGETLRKIAPGDYGDSVKYPYSYDWNLSSLDYLMQDC